MPCAAAFRRVASNLSLSADHLARNSLGALRRLLDDIAAGKIHVVVVYKVDRLTRSLSDFATRITVNSPREPIPLDWSEQRRMFGLIDR